MLLAYIMLESYMFRKISVKLLPKTKSSTIVETWFQNGQFCKCLLPLVNRISIKTLEKYLSIYWHIAWNVRTWLGIKDEIYIILTSRNVATMVTKKSKKSFSRVSHTLRLCACAECIVSKVIWFTWV